MRTPLTHSGRHSWLIEWAKVSVQMGFNASIFWKVVRTAPQDRDEQQIKSAIELFESKLLIAEHRLAQHQYLVGVEQIILTCDATTTG